MTADTVSYPDCRHMASRAAACLKSRCESEVWLSLTCAGYTCRSGRSPPLTLRLEETISSFVGGPYTEAYTRLQPLLRIQGRSPWWSPEVEYEWTLLLPTLLSTASSSLDGPRRAFPTPQPQKTPHTPWQ